MVKNDIIEIGNALAQYAIASYEQNKNNLLQQIVIAFSKIGELLNGEKLNSTYNNKIYEIVKNTLTLDFSYDKDKNTIPLTNLDNSISSNFANSLTTKGEEFMQRIKKIKNARIRVDGRFEWRKMINGQIYQIVEKNFEKFSKKIQKLKALIKQNKPPVLKKNDKIKQSLYQTSLTYYKRNIESKVERGILSKGSALRYEDALKKLKIFNLPLCNYTKDDIIDFFNNTKQHRTGSYCYFLLRRVFADEFEKGNIKRNPISTMENPYPPKRCGESGDWLNPDEQQILRNNFNNSIIAKEILFYVITGCRLIEAYDAQIDFDKAILRITRHKTRYSGVQCTTMPLSPEFCEIIKPDWNSMFKTPPKLLSKNITRYLEKIGIKNKSANDLRHTFSSNLYYLGVDPKLHQYLMGHRSIKLTYETYTTLDLAVEKKDIVNIWGNLYPNYKKDENL